MSANIQMICAIDNRTKSYLKRQEVHLNWGRFDDAPNKYPQEVINPRELASPAFCSSGRLGSSSGTEGTVVYRLGDNTEEWVRIYWDVSWVPGVPNQVKTDTFNPDVAAVVDGFDPRGPVENVTIRILDGR